MNLALPINGTLANDYDSIGILMHNRDKRISTVNRKFRAQFCVPRNIRFCE